MDGPSGKIKVINGFSIGKGIGVAQIIMGSGGTLFKGLNLRIQVNVGKRVVQQ